ncbi:MAG TPA: hypothetical protein VHZ25_07385 [Acidobacteriaceae bacterium]|jgi:hypothetical protein|nr:hypothetical protein [Acidobacteriaceae bacterium]
MKTDASDSSFSAAREAKEYLIGRIVAQAEQDGVELSEIERKMLYFSETAWTLPDMAEVSGKFDQDHNQEAYEAKIAEVVHNFHETAGEDDEETWNQASEALSSEDHYLLVLINPRLTRGRTRPQGSLVVPFLIGAGIAVLAAIGYWIFTRFQ